MFDKNKRLIRGYVVARLKFKEGGALYHVVDRFGADTLYTWEKLVSGQDTLLNYCIVNPGSNWYFRMTSGIPTIQIPEEVGRSKHLWAWLQKYDRDPQTRASIENARQLAERPKDGICYTCLKPHSDATEKKKHNVEDVYESEMAMLIGKKKVAIAKPSGASKKINTKEDDKALTKYLEGLDALRDPNRIAKAWGTKLIAWLKYSPTAYGDFVKHLGHEPSANTADIQALVIWADCYEPLRYAFQACFSSTIEAVLLSWEECFAKEKK